MNHDPVFIIILRPWQLITLSYGTAWSVVQRLDISIYYIFRAQSLSLIENCLTDIEGWMRTNMLKLNSDKAEVMLFTSKHNAIHMENVTVCFGDINVTSVNTVRNLGVIFDSALTIWSNS